MVLRGQNSDLLSEATVAAMRTRRPAMETITVPDQGHAPILSGADLIGRLGAFVASCEPASMPVAREQRTHAAKEKPRRP